QRGHDASKDGCVSPLPFDLLHGVAHLFFFQAEDGIRAGHVTGVQTCALPISLPLATGPWAAALAARAPFTYRRSVVPSKVPTRCVHVFSGSVGPFTGSSAPLAVRTRNFATPASRKSMYWLFTQPLTEIGRAHV